MGRLCQDCQKREATMHFTDIKDGKKTESHLCKQCAQKRQKDMAFPTSILSAIVQTISRHVDQGHDPAMSVALPRVHPMRGETETGERITYAEKINLEMTPERGWPLETDGELRAAGFETERVEQHAALGRVHLVARDGDLLPDFDGSGVVTDSDCEKRHGQTVSVRR